jgi:hypothetical protein
MQDTIVPRPSSEADDALGVPRAWRDAHSDEPRAHARRTDPGTSHAAAASVRDIRESQQYVLSLFRKFGPMTDERLALHIAEDQAPHVKLSPSGIRTRRSELVSLILLRFTGRVETISTGRKAKVWEAI